MCLDQSNQAELKQSFEDTQNHDVLIFDFRNVKHIQPEGFYLLIKAWLIRNQQNREIYGYALQDDIKWLMKLHRCWDLFKNHLCDSPEILMSRLKNQEKMTFYDSFFQQENLVTISLLGNLDKNIDYHDYMLKLTPIIGQKDCNIDFSYCTYIDNLGFSFLLNLKKNLDSQQHRLTLSSIHKNLFKLFQAVHLEDHFIYV